MTLSGINISKNISYRKYIDYLAANEPVFETYEIFSTEGVTPLSANQMLNFIISGIAEIAVPDVQVGTRMKFYNTQLMLLKSAELLKEKSLQSDFPAQLPQDAAAIEDPVSPGKPFIYKKDGKMALL